MVVNTSALESNTNQIENINDIIFLMQEYENYMIENPNVSNEQQSYFIEQLIQSEEFTVQKNNTMQRNFLPTGFLGLNSQEIQLANNNPGVDDNVDAFRHGYWSILMVSRVGNYYAKAWGDAHEYGQTTLSSQMDLLNNAIGRNAYLANKTDDQLALIITYKVNSGEMWRIVNGVLVHTGNGRSA